LHRLGVDARLIRAEIDYGTDDTRSAVEVARGQAAVRDRVFARVDCRRLRDFGQAIARREFRIAGEVSALQDRLGTGARAEDIVEQQHLVGGRYQIEHARAGISVENIVVQV